MKKIWMMLFALMVLSVGSVMADESTSANNDDWGLACSKEEFNHLSFGELLVSSSGATAVAASIVNTAQVDYKNKAIKVWVLYVMTPVGRQRNIDSLGSDYNGYGYTKQLKNITLKNNSTEIMSYANYNCDGSIIVSNTQPLGKDAIVPGSIDDTMVKDLRKKFKI